MEHIMKLKAIYFDKIKCGEKIYEIRLNDEKRSLINIGDTLKFKKEPEQMEEITTKVEDLIHFKSFSEMLNILPLDMIGFKNESADKVLEIYRKFYSTQDEEKYGVLAIKVKVLK